MQSSHARVRWGKKTTTQKATAVNLWNISLKPKSSSARENEKGEVQWKKKPGGFVFLIERSRRRPWSGVCVERSPGVTNLPKNSTILVLRAEPKNMSFFFYCILFSFFYLIFYLNFFLTFEPIVRGPFLLLLIFNQLHFFFLSLSFSVQPPQHLRKMANGYTINNVSTFRSCKLWSWLITSLFIFRANTSAFASSCKYPYLFRLHRTYHQYC